MLFRNLIRKASVAALMICLLIGVLSVTSYADNNDEDIIVTFADDLESRDLVPEIAEASGCCVVKYSRWQPRHGGKFAVFSIADGSTVKEKIGELKNHELIVDAQINTYYGLTVVPDKFAEMNFSGLDLGWSELTPGEDYVDGELMVSFDTGLVDKSIVDEIAEEYNCLNEKIISWDDWLKCARFSIKDGMTVRDKIEQLEENRYVWYGQPNFIYSMETPVQPGIPEEIYDPDKETGIVDIYVNATGGSWPVATVGFLNIHHTDAYGRCGVIEDAVKSGFRFDGWYDRPVGGKLVTAETVFTENATVYAHWTRTTAARSFTRLFGNNRYETAVAAAMGSYPVPQYSVVPGNYILVDGTKFPDALAANPYLAVHSVKEPCRTLLCRTDSIPEATRSLFSKGDQITLIGSGFKKAVFDELKAIGIEESRITQIGGKDRYETAVLVCQQMLDEYGSAQTVAVATGSKAADALSFSSVSYSRGIPILLTHSDGHADEMTKEMIARFENVILLGSEQVVSEDCLSDKQKQNGSYVRLGGNDRYETSVSIARQFWGSSEHDNYWLNDRTGIADGTDAHFPDALAAGQALKGVPLLLVKPGDTSNASMRYLRERAAGPHATTNLFQFFGYAAVSSSYNEVKNLIESGTV